MYETKNIYIYINRLNSPIKDKKKRIFKKFIVKDKSILTGVKRVRKTTQDYYEKCHDYCNRSVNEIRLDLQCSKESWGFEANEQSEGVSGWKVMMRRHQGQENSC